MISSLWYTFRDLFYSVNKELKRNGYYIVENILTPKECKNLLHEIEKDLSNGSINWQDTEGSDRRIYGWTSNVLAHVNITVKEDFQSYIGSSNSFTSFIMANEVVFKEGNKGSGGGWHRDSLNRRQLKLMIYLTSVDNQNGPFEYISRSHTFWNKFVRGVLFKENRRISELRIKEKRKIKTFEGKAGMGIIFDSSGIHRGRPIAKENRVAVTYYTFATDIPSHIKQLMN